MDEIQFIKENFLAYCCYINENFKVAPHIIKIARLLDDFSNGKITKLIISLPPRMGKSYLNSILLPTYLLGRNPKEKILIN